MSAVFTYANELGYEPGLNSPEMDNDSHILQKQLSICIHTVVITIL